MADDTFGALQENVNSMQGMFSSSQDAANETAPKISTKMENGQIRATVDMEMGQLQKIMSALQAHSQAVGAMQQREQFLKQQEDRTRRNPLLSVLTSVAGHLGADDKRLPPLVSALGKASLELNPGANAIAQERTDLNRQIATQTEADIRSGYQYLEFQQKRQEDAYKHQADLDEKSEKRIQKAMEFVLKTPGLTPDTVDKTAKAYGLTPEETAMFKGMVQDKAAHEKQKDDFTEKMTKYKAQEAAKAHQLSAATADKRLEAMAGNQAAGREFRAYGKIEKDINGEMKAFAAAEHLQEIISDPANTNYLGVIMGHVPEYAIADPDERRKVSGIRAEFFTLLNSVKDSFGAGSYFWRPQEFSNLSPKLATATKTMQADQGILDTLKADSIRVAAVGVRDNPDIDWETRGPIVFGRLWPEVQAQAGPTGAKGGLQGKAGGKGRMDEKKKDKELTYNPATGKVE